MSTAAASPSRMTKTNSNTSMSRSLMHRDKSIVEKNPEAVQGPLRYTLALE